MLGQPASSHTVCSPSRRTSDLSSVYSGPVLSRVLIHSGLRSMGTWLLRTSRRSSLRPAGSIRAAGAGVDAAVSVMIPTVRPAPCPAGTAIPAGTTIPAGTRQSSALALGLLPAVGQRRAGLTEGGALVVGGVGDRVDAAGLLAGSGRALGRAAGGRVERGGHRRVRRAAGVGLGDVTLGHRRVGHLLRLHAQVGVRRRGVAGAGLRGRRRPVGGRGTGHGILPVAGNGTVAGG